MELPPRLPGTAVRILATSDLGANAVPLRTTTGPGGTIHGVAALLEREESALWLDLGDFVVAELRPGELERARRAQWALADPANRATDALAENWCRMPAGISGDGASVATLAAVVPRLREWLGRDLEAAPSGVSARDALIAALMSRGADGVVPDS
jgi:hypothetical protein